MNDEGHPEGEAILQAEARDLRAAIDGNKRVWMAFVLRPERRAMQPEALVGEEFILVGQLGKEGKEAEELWKGTLKEEGA